MSKIVGGNNRKLYSEDKNYKLYKGNMTDMLETIETNSIDSIVTDPPYELNFMSKGWDNAGISFKSDTWKKCYEVLKPGGYLLAFGGSRTFHRIACAIEDAGFEIRDTVMWLYGSGFPKSMNIGLAIDKKNGIESKVVGLGQSGSADTHTRTMNSQTKNGKDVFGGKYEIKEAQNEWKGWGSCLKPSFEPIIVARKPFKGSLVDNVIENGVGGLNIDECRNPLEDDFDNDHSGFKSENNNTASANPTGRFPSNTILTYDETDFDEVCGGFSDTKGGSVSRYFYCAKASKKDRDEGLDEFEKKQVRSLECGDSDKEILDDVLSRFRTIKRNTHPTVKPTELMQYLVRLVTPNGGTVLDPFNGSGSTGKAVMYENKEHNKNYKYIGIELTEEYLPISKARIEYVINNQGE